jgi:hypothetical protein
MPTRDFVVRGKSGKGVDNAQTINFGGRNQGYGYRIVEFQLYQSAMPPSSDAQLCAIITAGKTALDPLSPDFSTEGVIATSLLDNDAADHNGVSTHTIIDDTFMITQDIILTCDNTEAHDINWQIKFRPVKMSETEQANQNYRQFSIFDE